MDRKIKQDSTGENTVTLFPRCPAASRTGDGVSEPHWNSTFWAVSRGTQDFHFKFHNQSDRIILEPRIEIPCIPQGFWTGSFTYVCLNSYNEHMLKTNSSSVKGNRAKYFSLPSGYPRPLSPYSKTADPVHTALQPSPACVCHWMIDTASSPSPVFCFSFYTLAGLYRLNTLLPCCFFHLKSLSMSPSLSLFFIFIRVYLNQIDSTCWGARYQMLPSPSLCKWAL